MTHSINLNEQDTPPTGFTTSQKRAIIIFALFGVITVAAAFAYTLQLGAAMDTLSAAFWQRLLHK